jgi:hypothetical protein
VVERLDSLVPFYFSLHYGFRSLLHLGRIGSRFDEIPKGVMKAKAVVFVLAMIAVIATLALLHPHSRPSIADLGQGVVTPSETADESGSPLPTTRRSGAYEATSRPAGARQARAAQEPETLASGTNKLERLAQIRQQFEGLAAGDPGAAMQAAKLIQDETERETALLTLVTQWKHGELRSPRERASAIDRYGLEAGLGMELVDNPELAVSWAHELTEGLSQRALLSQTAIGLTGEDPSAAFALGEHLPEKERQRFFDTVFAGWASKDTQGALDFADQLPDQAQRDEALKAIRSEAPVGIGTVMAMKDGYPVVQQLLPGTPAELSGQLHLGDRIVALAQGDNSFVAAQGVPLANLVQMIRGEPGTTLQLQILPGDAPPGSLPQTISITRDQLKFKR